uniref:Uncharacterized protein n=1 Tax=Arundo donax TaxID=35708 RepID=A0A0A9B7X3_ARUDO
MGAIGRRGRGG